METNKIIGKNPSQAQFVKNKTKKNMISLHKPCQWVADQNVQMQIGLILKWKPLEGS